MNLEQIAAATRSMIEVSDEEMDFFMQKAFVKTFKKKESLTELYAIPNEIFFINKGILRVVIVDMGGTEHTVHFALENQFICDYASFLTKTKSVQDLQALEDTEVVVIPRESIEWGYANLKNGDRMGRLIAEYYFIYLNERINNLYTKTPKERYDMISEVFPNIHQRVPQHMIASYLGITPVHLSRLKKADLNKA